MQKLCESLRCKIKAEEDFMGSKKEKLSKTTSAKFLTILECDLETL